MKSCRLISLLNVDTKILSRAIPNESETVLPTLICSQQTVYVKTSILEDMVY